MINPTTQKATPPQECVTHISGALLIAHTMKQAEHKDGLLPHGVGIFYQYGNSFHPYVVWTTYTDDMGETWYAENGDYCTDVFEAVKRYKERGGK